MVDGTIMDQSLLDMVIATQRHSADNNVIKFSDNSRCDLNRVSFPAAYSSERFERWTSNLKSKDIELRTEQA